MITKVLFIPIMFLLLAYGQLPTVLLPAKGFCIKKVKLTTTATVGEVTINLPNGESYTGQGVVPIPVKIKKHKGQMSSVITSQIQTDSGMELELVHLFDDGQGNIFWTNDTAVLRALDDTGTRFQVHTTINVADGTGDFECAKGQLINEGPLDFVAGKLEINLTGSVCGGCQ